MADSPEEIERGEQRAQPKPTVGEVRAIHLSQQHEGPLPPAEQLAAYDDRFPGFGERIMRMAEKNLDHTMKMQEEELALEREIYRNDAKRSTTSLYLGSTIIFGTVAGGLTLVFLGHDTAGAAIVGSVVTALAFVFATSLNQKRRELPPSSPTHDGGQTDIERKV